MTSRLRSLAGTAILTLPLAATAAVIPAAAAQAGTRCGPDQATVHFADRPPACQSAGIQILQPCPGHSRVHGPVRPSGRNFPGRQRSRPAELLRRLPPG